MINNFTLQSYTELLIYFKKTHKFLRFIDYKQSKGVKTILLRHDIDYSLTHALKVAKLEYDLGVRSTYFLLFSSPFYNILDSENIEIVNQIKEYGHEIGLHYDVSVMLKGKKESPTKLFNAQIELLNVLTNNSIESIAMHNPSTSGEDIFKNIDYINAYDKKFTTDIAYFSDSCMAWRDNFIENYNLNNFPNKFQLLIHPILWTKNNTDRYTKLDLFFDSKKIELLNEVNKAKKIWRNHSGVIEHDLRIKKIKRK